MIKSNIPVRWFAIPILLIQFVFSVPLYGGITRVFISKTEAFLEGRQFGTAGSYLLITGQFYGEVDPGNTFNSIIQDISLAPVNDKGMVEYISDFVILKPANMSKSNGLIFLSLPNRGNMIPADTTLLGRGYVYVWCAWQGDVLKGGNRLTMRVPYASENGNEIAGILRTEYQVAESAKTLDLSAGFFTGNTHYSYETVSIDNTECSLTRRVLESDKRELIPNSDWTFSDCTKTRFPGVPNPKKISLRDEFTPGFIYELIYKAKNPLVLGLGFAAIRDVCSFLRYDLIDKSGYPNPLADKGMAINPVKAAIMQGVSQCSNFARTFLFLGFNQDENGRQVFDGINAHIGTRRISLNVRFGRPGGGGLQHEDHLFPGNDPPFTWSAEYDSISGIKGGILQRCSETNTCPKIIQTLSSSEYWQLRASLTTTDSYGKRDLKIPDNVRIYLFSGTQHSPMDAADQMSGFRQNYNSYYPYHRALIIALEKWILEGKLPPDSRYPTISAGTLVMPSRESVGWPDIPGIPYNGKANELPLMDYGPNYDYRNVTGILTIEPPVIKSKQIYRTLVPKVDEDGNEVAGIRGINIRVPVGTFTGWSLRKEGFGRGDLSGLNGMFIAFKKTRTDRKETGDSRRSLQERYGSHEKYVSAVRKAAEALVAEGFLLPNDARLEIEKAEKSNILK